MIKLNEEKDKTVLETWKERANEVNTPNELTDFVTSLINDYEHDYDTIVHAMWAAMLAAGNVINRSTQSGITGRQAKFIAWSAMDDLRGSVEGPKRILAYEDLLYPQYDDKFNTISEETHKWLIKKAEELLRKESNPHPDVKERWKMIASGSLPDFIQAVTT